MEHKVTVQQNVTFAAASVAAVGLAVYSYVAPVVRMPMDYGAITTKCVPAAVLLVIVVMIAVRVVGRRAA